MIAVFSDSKVAKHSFDSAQHVDNSVVAIAPPPEFRRGYGEDAVKAGDACCVQSRLSTQQILEVAFNIQKQKKSLSRKEFGGFVHSILKWTQDTTRKYLNIAKTYVSFPDLSALSGIEPFTLLRLCSKKYIKVIEKLKEEKEISQLRIAELIKELVPKAPKEKTYAKEYGDAVLQRHANMEDGTFYFTLKEVNLSDEAGLWLKEKLATQTVGQILQQFSEWEKKAEVAIPTDYRLAQLEELDAVIADAREQRAAAAQARLELRHEQDAKRALEQEVSDLKARLEQRRLEAMPELGNDYTVMREEVPSPEPEQSLQTPEPEPVEHNFSSWPEFTDTVGSDRKTLMSEVRNWSTAERQALSTLLAEHLESLQHDALDDVAWVPEKLLHSALSTLSFTVSKIGGGDNLVDEPEIEHINGCRFVSLQHLGNSRREQWVFESHDGRTFCVFGRDEFAIDSF